jgi:hypothetical protein
MLTLPQRKCVYASRNCTKMATRLGLALFVGTECAAMIAAMLYRTRHALWELGVTHASPLCRSTHPAPNAAVIPSATANCPCPLLLLHRSMPPCTVPACPSVAIFATSHASRAA